MLKYMRENMNLLQEYCEKKGLLLDNILNNPICYNDNFMAIQYCDLNSKAAKLGLADSTPAKVLLIIRKTDNGVEFEQTEYTEKYLGIDLEI